MRDSRNGAHLDHRTRRRTSRGNVMLRWSCAPMSEVAHLALVLGLLFRYVFFESIDIADSTTSGIQTML